MNEYKQPFILDGITMVRKDEKLYITIEDANVSTKVYMGKKPCKEAITIQSEKNEKGTFIFDAPVVDAPFYFYYVSDGSESNVFGERVLPLEGAINVRDMGGFKTTDGKSVKWGVLYRGDQLSKLTELDIQILERIGLKTIVDYRSEHECTINPNKDINGVKTYHCDPKSSFSEAAAQANDIHEENANLVNALENGSVDVKYINGSGKKVMESYEDLVVSEASQICYGTLLKVLSDRTNAPLLHHCRGGKDRTGFGSLLILMLLNVKESDIVMDYIITGIVRTKRNELKYSHYRSLTDNKDYLDYLMSLIDTKAEYIQAAIDKIKKEYGTMENYAKEFFQLSDQEIQAIREYYVEEGN